MINILDFFKSKKEKKIHNTNYHSRKHIPLAHLPRHSPLPTHTHTHSLHPAYIHHYYHLVLFQVCWKQPADHTIPFWYVGCMRLLTPFSSFSSSPFRITTILRSVRMWSILLIASDDTLRPKTSSNFKDGAFCSRRMTPASVMPLLELSPSLPRWGRFCTRDFTHISVKWLQPVKFRNSSFTSFCNTRTI